MNKNKSRTRITSGKVVASSNMKNVRQRHVQPEKGSMRDSIRHKSLLDEDTGFK